LRPSNIGVILEEEKSDEEGSIVGEDTLNESKRKVSSPLQKVQTSSPGKLSSGGFEEENVQETS